MTLATLLRSQFLRFCLVGGAGFLIDTGVLYAAVFGLGIDRYSGRVISFLVAATANWAINRHFTFRASRAPSRGEWAQYVTMMLFGAAANYGTYAALIAAFPAMHQEPALAVAGGTLAGLGLNFLAAKYVVFRGA